MTKEKKKAKKTNTTLGMFKDDPEGCLILDEVDAERNRDYEITNLIGKVGGKKKAIEILRSYAQPETVDYDKCIELLACNIYDMFSESGIELYGSTASTRRGLVMSLGFTAFGESHVVLFYVGQTFQKDNIDELFYDALCFKNHMPELYNKKIILGAVLGFEKINDEAKEYAISKGLFVITYDKGFVILNDKGFKPIPMLEA